MVDLAFYQTHATFDVTQGVLGARFAKIRAVGSLIQFKTIQRLDLRVAVFFDRLTWFGLRIGLAPELTVEIFQQLIIKRPTRPPAVDISRRERGRADEDNEPRSPTTNPACRPVIRAWWAWWSMPGLEN